MHHQENDEADSGILDLSSLIEAYRHEAPEEPSLLREPLWLAPPRITRTPPPIKTTKKIVGWLLAGKLAAALMLFATMALAAYEAPTRMVLSPGSDATMEEPPRVLLEPRPEIPEAAQIPDATEPAVAAPLPAPIPRSSAQPRSAPRSETTTTVEPAHRWATGDTDERDALDPTLDQLLERAIGDGDPDPARDATGPVSLPATPTRRQVSTTLRALEGEVAQCGEGQVTVRLVVEGQTGAVRSVVVSGAENATAASCVATTVRSARFPRFERESFSIVFPYRL